MKKQFAWWSSVQARESGFMIYEDRYGYSVPLTVTASRLDGIEPYMPYYSDYIYVGAVYDRVECFVAPLPNGFTDEDLYDIEDTWRISLPPESVILPHMVKFKEKVINLEL